MNLKQLRYSLLLLVCITVSCCALNKDSNDEASMHNKPKHHTAKGYQNAPFVVSASSKGFFFYLRRIKASLSNFDIPVEHVLSEEEAIKQFTLSENSSITWLGHASFLIQISGKTILTDPFLTKRASPVSWAGPQRYIPAGISIAKLPKIDFIIVSHSHYDHLDDETVRNIKHKDEIQVFVPLGLKSFFVERGYSKVKELDWNESVQIGELEFLALPAVHDSARSANDRDKTLWASWSVANKIKKYYFIGDSGYSESIFKNIGSLYGPFDYAILPIGAYQPRELMWMSHVNPEEAVKIGKEVKADILVASHWGTINLSDEPVWEPPKKFRAAGFESGFTEDKLWIMKIGETRSSVK